MQLRKPLPENRSILSNPYVLLLIGIAIGIFLTRSTSPSSSIATQTTQQQVQKPIYISKEDEDEDDSVRETVEDIKEQSHSHKKSNNKNSKQSSAAATSLVSSAELSSKFESLSFDDQTFWKINKYVQLISPSLQKTFNDYKELHRKIMDKNDKSVPKRFLLHRVTPYDNMGFGNRMFALLSAFLFAWVTDRAFIIDWSSANDPFYIGDFFQDPFNWHMKSVHSLFDQNYINGHSNFLKIYYGDNYELILCRDFNEQFSQQFLLLESNQYFLPMILHNERYKQKVLDAGFIPGHIAAPLINFLLNLAPNVQQRVDEFKAQHFGEYNIAIQIRTKDGHSTSDGITKFAFKCAGVISENLPGYLQKKIHWYLASDGTHVRDYALTNFKDKHISYLDCPLDYYSKSGIECSLVHMWLLGECDDMVMSRGSTFGDMAHSRKHITPMMISLQGHCVRQASPDPCFHHWKNIAKNKVSCLKDSMYVQEDLNGCCVTDPVPL